MTHAKLMSFGLLVAALAVAGCGDRSATQATGSGKETTKAKAGGATNDHAPHGAGPNGGVVSDLGKYHAEFTVDHPKKKCVILVLGPDEKNPTPHPVAAKELTLTTKETKTREGKVVSPMTIKLLPKDEKDGKASKFVGTDPGLGNVADFAGTVTAVIDGKPSTGEFQE
jgi:hypothetical protein